MSYTVEELNEKYLRAEELMLSGAELLLDPNAGQICNGIGAEWMPSALRDAITSLHKSLVLAADIHDCRYEIGGDEGDRAFADKEFLANALVLADDAYNWYDPRRYIARRSAHRFYDVLRIFGSRAWKRRKTMPNEH